MAAIGSSSHARKLSFCEPLRANCASNNFTTPRTTSFTFTGSSIRRRHACEIAEPADDGFELRQFREQRRGALSKNLVELRRIALARALQIFDGDLQREKRILQFMRQTAGQFTPGGDAFGLNRALALCDQLLGHLVEGAREVADFIAGGRFHAHGPISAGDGTRAHRPASQRAA